MTPIPRLHPANDAGEPLTGLAIQYMLARNASDVAEAKTESVQLFGPEWFALRRESDRLSCDASEARAALRNYCREIGLTAAMLDDVKEVL